MVSNKMNYTIDDFGKFRLNYLIVYVVVMLADGMQGTHLFALYSEYSCNVASLYALGFLAGALSSPFIGAMVDKCGRKRSAMAYCVLEILINQMEQYNCLLGLVLSRAIGGVTTNLLFTVFESWVVTEHRRRGFAEEKFEVILRDSVIASNVSAVASGLIAHYLAETLGLAGPFRGAVSCTMLALLLVAVCWDENYGLPLPGNKNLQEILKDGVKIVLSDSRILRLGVIQGLTEGSLQTFVFLWSPTLLHLTSNHKIDKFASLFLDHNNEPAYGLIFGAFMACGALGGYSQPFIYNLFHKMLQNRLKTFQSSAIAPPVINIDDASSCASSDLVPTENSSDSEADESITTSSDSDTIRLISANMQAATCFLLCSILLAIPVYFESFSLLIIAFLLYEFMIGMYLPCEGILRSIYLPEDEVCTLMTLLRVIVNVLVAFGVVLTNFVPFKSAFIICSTSLALASFLQYTLVNQNQWIWINANNTFKQQSIHPAKIITIDTNNTNSIVSQLSMKIKSE